jgi:two-component SAPR family response regulator
MSTPVILIIDDDAVLRLDKLKEMLPRISKGDVRYINYFTEDSLLEPDKLAPDLNLDEIARIRPQLIFLDLALHQQQSREYHWGIDQLKKLKNHSGLKNVPVIIISTFANTPGAVKQLEKLNIDRNHRYDWQDLWKGVAAKDLQDIVKKELDK